MKALKIGYNCEEKARIEVKMFKSCSPGLDSRVFEREALAFES